MAVLWCKKAKRGAGIKLSLNDAGGVDKSVDDAWLVRCDSQDTDYTEIALAPGISPGDTLEGSAFTVCTEVSARPVGNSGMLWLVSPKYARRSSGRTTVITYGLPDDEWSASGSTSSTPVFMDAPPGGSQAPQIIRNTAGDPIQGLTIDRTDYTLSLTRAYRRHSEWMGVVNSHGDHINSNFWNGSDPETWLCRFLSAQVQVQSGDSGQSQSWLVYWLVRWEFAYNANSWRAKPWNAGYNELHSGNRRAILDEDGRPTRSPVALSGSGAALSATATPAVLNWWWGDNSAGIPVYPTANFSIFGSISTPVQ